MNEKPILFHCQGEHLVGILSEPSKPVSQSTGVLISVGGPQYRVGSHRQFVTLARDLAQKGFYVFRFDYRGMGDSSGAAVSFDAAGPDIASAIDTMIQEVPSIKKIVLWGICDAATINMMYAVTDNRVAGLVLLNPWIYSEAGEAETRLKHYYSKRFLTAEFWKKLVSNKVDVGNAIKEISRRILASLNNKLRPSHTSDESSLPDRFERSFCDYQGSILLIISGNDLTAAEFMDRMQKSKKWHEKVRSDKTVFLHELKEANHTFSRQIWKDEVASFTSSWLKKMT